MLPSSSAVVAGGARPGSGGSWPGTTRSLSGRRHARDQPDRGETVAVGGGQLGRGAGQQLGQGRPGVLGQLVEPEQLRRGRDGERVGVATAHRPAGERGRRPQVRQVVRDVGEVAAVVLRLLAHQRRPVRDVQGFQTEPRSSLPCGVQQLPRRLHPTGALQPHRPHRVGATARDPLVARGRAVGDQRRHESAPHPDGRVVAPAVRVPGQRPQDLQGLHPLLAEPLVVQHRGAGTVVGVPKECLHHDGVPLMHPCGTDRSAGPDLSRRRPRSPRGWGWRTGRGRGSARPRWRRGHGRPARSRGRRPRP